MQLRDACIVGSEMLHEDRNGTRLDPAGFVNAVDEIAKTQLLHLANRRGFDDALFVDPSGRISEATIWNVAFWDAGSVVWPEADLLPGVTMQILQRQFARLGVQQTVRPVMPSDLHARMAAVLMNSWSPGIPIARVGEQALADTAELVDLLERAYLAEEPVSL